MFWAADLPRVLVEYPPTPTVRLYVDNSVFNALTRISRLKNIILKYSGRGYYSNLFLSVFIFSKSCSSWRIFCRFSFKIFLNWVFSLVRLLSICSTRKYFRIAFCNILWFWRFFSWRHYPSRPVNHGSSASTFFNFTYAWLSFASEVLYFLNFQVQLVFFQVLFEVVHLSWPYLQIFLEKMVLLVSVIVLFLPKSLFSPGIMNQRRKIR